MAVWYGTVRYGMVWYGMVWYGMAWHGADASVLRLAAAAVMPVVATSSTAASTSEAVCSLDLVPAIDFVHEEDPSDTGRSNCRDHLRPE